MGQRFRAPAHRHGSGAVRRHARFEPSRTVMLHIVDDIAPTLRHLAAGYHAQPYAAAGLSSTPSTRRSLLTAHP